MEAKIKTFEDCEVKDSLFRYWGLFDTEEVLITQKTATTFFDTPRIKISVEGVGELVPNFVPNNSYQGNHYTTKKEAQQKRNSDLMKEIANLSSDIVIIEGQIAHCKNQIIKI